MKHFSRADILDLPQRHRARLINSISGFKSANLVGTKSPEGYENLSIVSSVVHLGSNPALLGMVMRPPSVPRHTYENILSTETYTLNAIPKQLARAAHQTSARYDQAQSEFDATELEAFYRENWTAPYVGGAPVQLGMRLVEDVEIKHNGTRLIIGAVEHIYMVEGIQQPDGFVDLAGAGVVSIGGLDAYHVPELAFRLSYAKPDVPLKTLALSGASDVD